MAPSAEERAGTPPGEGTRWRLAILLPVMALSGVAVVWTFMRVWEAQSLLAGAGAPRTWWLAVTFRESTAQAVVGEWRALQLPPAAHAAVRADWWMLGAYIVFLTCTGLLLMWFLRFERRSFAPVLLCFPLAGAFLGVAENLCVLGMLAEPDRPSAMLALIGGIAGTSKIILLAETLIAIVWALGRLRHRIRHVDAHLLNFSGVLAGERRYLARRRVLAGVAASPSAAENARPIGLALSGGGIRSATFNLGVLQALARLDILRRFDYLSTVSGGGYIGACLTSLLSHRKSWPAGKPRTGDDAYTFPAAETPYFGTTAATLPFNPNVAEQFTMHEFNGQDEIATSAPTATSSSCGIACSLEKSCVPSATCSGASSTTSSSSPSSSWGWREPTRASCSHGGLRAPRGRPPVRAGIHVGPPGLAAGPRGARLSVAVGHRHRRRHHPGQPVRRRGGPVYPSRPALLHRGPVRGGKSRVLFSLGHHDRESLPPPR